MSLPAWPWVVQTSSTVLLLSAFSALSRSVAATSALGLALAALLCSTTAGLLGLLCVPVGRRSRRRAWTVVLPLPAVVAIATAASVAQAGADTTGVLLATLPWLMGVPVAVSAGQRLRLTLPAWSALVPGRRRRGSPAAHSQ
jgi:hypothetical protein